jgi:hypothetical protein
MDSSPHSGILESGFSVIRGFFHPNPFRISYKSSVVASVLRSVADPDPQQLADPALTVYLLNLELKLFDMNFLKYFDALLFIRNRDTLGVAKKWRTGSGSA